MLFISNQSLAVNEMDDFLVWFCFIQLQKKKKILHHN